MGFSKANNRKEIQIVVTHPQHPGDKYVFTVPKKLPQAALDAEKRFLDLGDATSSDDWRKALINVVAEMVTKEPEGFDDFPELQSTQFLDSRRTLSERMRAYFDDPEQPEFEAIIVSAWKAYKAAAVPAAYIKSTENSGEASGQSSGVSGEASSGV